MSIRQAFRKSLSANDVGSTKAHQAGIHIPKTAKALLDFLPPLDPQQRNPDAWIQCMDERGEIHRFRYVYYNNKLHAERGTRNEYRITHMTGYLKRIEAKENDIIEISKSSSEGFYKLCILKAEGSRAPSNDSKRRPIKLMGWSRVY